MRWWQRLQTEDILVATHQPRSTLSLEDEVRSLLGAGALEWAHALAADLTREYVEKSIPELAQSVVFAHSLRISAEANILAMLLTLSSQSSDARPPREALDYARDAVARQVPLVAVLRGYRLGVEHWLRWCAPVIARYSDPTDQADELQNAVTVAVRYSDRLSEIMIVEYERELQRRATSGAGRRAALVRAVIAGDVVDVDETSQLLHYPLRGRHMALALHLRAGSTNEVEALETEARSFAASVGATGLLTVATGLTTLDAWVAVRENVIRPHLSTREEISIGVGTPLIGVAGFIESHREAQAALQILLMATPGRLHSVTHYDRVRLLSLVTKDVPGVRAFVSATLGSLAGTDERSRELRETLLAYFEANKSYTAVARSSHLHKNTVVQRVTRASELTGRDMSHHVDTHVALMLADVLGERVLAAPDA